MNNHRNILVALLLLTAASLLGGCKKFLQQEQYNNVSVNEIFQDLQGARTTLIACYDNLKDASYYQRNFGLYADLAGGNIKYGRLTSVGLLLNYNFTNTNVFDLNDMGGFYQVGYNTIYRANNVIANIGRVQDANEQQRNRLLAEAYCIRAMVHFDLVRVFAQPYSFSANGSHTGIVIRTQNTGANTVIGEPASVGAVYAQIKSDLDSAMQLYTNSVPIYASGSENTYLSYDAAAALLSRVLLYTQEWSRSAQLATALIATNKYRLVSNATYASSWVRSASPNIDQEAIFMLFARTDVNQASFGDNFNAANNTFGYMATSNDLLNLYDAGDVRGRRTMFDSSTNTSQRGFYTRKYPGNNSTANNQKLLRISEVYLNRAEALAESGDFTGALADLNRIRLRANLSATPLVITNKQELLDAIFAERRRELCFEGHLFFDIVRQKRNLVRTDCTSSTCNITYPSPLFAVPIPTQR